MRFRRRPYRHPRTNLLIRERLWHRSIPFWDWFTNHDLDPERFRHIHFFIPPRRQELIENNTLFKLRTSPELSVRYAYTLPGRWGIYVIEDAPRYHHIYYKKESEYSIPCPYIYYVIQDQQFNTDRYDTRLMSILFSVERVTNLSSSVDACPLPNVHTGTFPCYQSRVYDSSLSLFDRIANELTVWWEADSNGDYTDDRWKNMPACVKALGQHPYATGAGSMLKRWSKLSAEDLLLIPWRPVGNLGKYIPFQNNHTNMPRFLVDRPFDGLQALVNHQGKEAAGML